MYGFWDQKREKSYLQENTDTGFSVSTGYFSYQASQFLWPHLLPRSSPQSTIQIQMSVHSHTRLGSEHPSLPHLGGAANCKALCLCSLPQLALTFHTQLPCPPRSLLEPPSTAITHWRCKFLSIGHNYSNNQMNEYRERDTEQGQFQSIC